MITGTTGSWGTSGAAAIDDPERIPTYKVNVQWGATAGTEDNITPDVLSMQGRIEMEDALTGYVPSGAVSGDLDVMLSSGSKYSSYNGSSPLYGVEKKNRDATTYVGFYTENGSEWLQQFLGKTKKLDVQSADRKTALYAVDKSELLKRKQLTWELMTDQSSDRVVQMTMADAGMGGQVYGGRTKFLWRANGSYDDGGRLAGTLSNCNYISDKWGAASHAITSANVANSADALWNNVSINNFNNEGFLSFWNRGGGGFWCFDKFGNIFDWIFLAVGTSGVDITSRKDWVNDGTQLYHVGSNLNTYGSWNNVIATWGTDKIIEAYVNGTLAGSANIGTDSWPTSSNWLNIIYCTIYGSNAGSSGTAYSGGDNFGLGLYKVPQNEVEIWYQVDNDHGDWAICDEGLNEISYLVVDEKNAWELIKDICQAEGAAFYFDGQGKAHFQNRLHSLNPPHHTSQKTISYNADAMNLSISEDLEQIINRTVVTANPYDVQGSSDVWSAQTPITIPKNGTVIFWANFDDPCLQTDTSFTAGTIGSQSRHSAAYYNSLTGSWIDKSGSVGLFGTAFSKAMKILGTNKMTTKDLTLVDTTGAPAVTIWGVPVKSTESEDGVAKIRAIYENTDSIGSFGEKTLEIQNNFISDYEYADFLAMYLISYYNNPKPRLENVEIMGDPRLEIGDRVTVQDSSGATGINDEFWVTGIDWSLAGAYYQNLKLDYAGTSNWFIIDYSKVDYGVIAF